MRPCLWPIGRVGVWWLLLFAPPPLLGDRSLDLSMLGKPSTREGSYGGGRRELGSGR